MVVGGGRSGGTHKTSSCPTTAQLTSKHMLPLPSSSLPPTHPPCLRPFPLHLRDWITVMWSQSAHLQDAVAEVLIRVQELWPKPSDVAHILLRQQVLVLLQQFVPSVIRNKGKRGRAAVYLIPDLLAAFP
eukprot:3007614-Rhodomonas_salina.2